MKLPRRLFGALAFSLLALFAGCNSQPESLTLATGKRGTVYNEVGGVIASMLADELRTTVKLDTSLSTGTVANCRKLLSGEVDFALVQDDTPLDSCIVPGSKHQASELRTILPIFPEIFFVFHQSGMQANSLRELLKGKRVGLDARSSSNTRFALRLFQEFGVDTTDFTPVFLTHHALRVSDSLPVVCMLTAYTDPKVVEQIKVHGADLFSLDDPNLKGRGSAADGFCLKYVYAHTFILPKFTFGDFPAKPILTVAVDALLATRRDVDAELVYEVTRLLVEEEAWLASQNILFRFLTEDFDRHTLDFPLHEGTLRYLARDEPSFIERFAEVIAMSISAVILLYGLFSGIFRWLRLRKKNRIDVYYQSVLQLEADLGEHATAPELHTAIEQLHRLRQEAFAKLVAEQLMANESFLIFTQLLANVQENLKQRLARIEQQL